MVTVDFLQITKSEQVFESGGHPSTYRPRPPAPHRQEYRTPPGMKASFESFQIFVLSQNPFILRLKFKIFHDSFLFNEVFIKIWSYRLPYTIIYVGIGSRIYGSSTIRAGPANYRQIFKNQIELNNR